jgi:hypothetical protein
MQLFIDGTDISTLKIAISEPFEFVEIDTNPELFLAKIVEFLNSKQLSFKNFDKVHVSISGISATALRSSITIINTFAFVHNLNLYGYILPENYDKITVVDIFASKISPHESGSMLNPIYQNMPKITQTNKDNLMRKYE